MNQSMRTLILACALPFILSLVVSTAIAGDDFTNTWQEADTKRKAAGKLGAEWRDTGKTLKKAKAEAEAGNLKNAMKLVAKAHEEADDAIAQHGRESTLWAARVPQ